MSGVVTDLSPNGIDVAALRDAQDKARRDPTTAERRPQLTAHWVGGSRTRVEAGDQILYLGGDGELRPMRALLAALAACDVDVIVTQAALLGMALEQLSVQVEGQCNVAAYLGVDDAPGPGYRGIHLTVRLRAPGATPEQIDALRRRLKHGSPVGDSLMRAVPLELTLEVERAGQ
jgi:uncharacterized OsmC-like protein